MLAFTADWKFVKDPTAFFVEKGCILHIVFLSGAFGLREDWVTGVQGQKSETGVGFPFLWGRVVNFSCQEGYKYNYSRA